MEYGPQNYLPPVEAEVVRRVHEITLDSNEGIYVRDIRTGSVEAISGQAYMLRLMSSITRSNYHRLKKICFLKDQIEHI